MLATVFAAMVEYDGGEGELAPSWTLSTSTFDTTSELPEGDNNDLAEEEEGESGFDVSVDDNGILR